MTEERSFKDQWIYDLRALKTRLSIRLELFEKGIGTIPDLDPNYVANQIRMLNHRIKIVSFLKNIELTEDSFEAIFKSENIEPIRCPYCEKEFSEVSMKQEIISINDIFHVQTTFNIKKKEGV